MHGDVVLDRGQLHVEHVMVHVLAVTNAAASRFEVQSLVGHSLERHALRLYLPHDRHRVVRALMAFN